ncbi:MAG TPA: glycoside hydrolase family 2 TIM barrel-domain containing protein [Ohtaekwangia sp.]
MKTAIKLIYVLIVLNLAACGSDPDFVKVKDTHFEIQGQPYFFSGTNFWYGANLASKGEGGNRERLIRELDALKAMGVTNLRIMAGSEGPDTEPYRMVPAIQTSPGVYNMDVVDGLDFLLHEMKKRDMRAVMCLANFWNWSGGMGQYIVWSGAADSIPYPPPHPGGTWDGYQGFVSQFYSNQKAVDMLNEHIRYVVNRTNGYSGTAYKDDPTIMAWELANEPRGINNIDAYRKWITATAAMIKQLDANHLVTTGSEGTTSSSYSGTEPETDHADPNIDYQTVHIWVQNWNVYDPQKPDSTFEPSVNYMKAYLKKHEEASRKLNKPMVLEEFGISRDSNSHVPNSPTLIRDKYYEQVFDAVYQYAKEKNTVVAGVNFWAWAGEGRPKTPEGLWHAGDDFIGDPAHETQGWYSVYDKDSTTIDVIKKYTAMMNSIKP